MESQVFLVFLQKIKDLHEMKYSKKLKWLLIGVFSGVMFSGVFAQSLIVRPEASIGYMPTFGQTHDNAVVQNYGGKVLMGLSDALRFGLKMDWVSMNFDTHVRQEYVSTGIVLEAVVAKYFNAGIGTVGYIATNNKINHNPFVLYTHLGFEYPFDCGLLLLCAYQADFVFTRPFGLNNAFRMGIGYRIPIKTKKHSNK